MMRKRGLLVLTALIIVMALLYAMELSGLKVAMLVGTALMAMTPLTLAAVGECINQKAGLFNIGVEGILLLTAFAGVFGAELFNSWAIGILFGAFVGALTGLSLGVMSVYGRADQIIAGMGINVFALGLVAYLLMALWAIPGIHVCSPGIRMPSMSTPLGSVSPLVFVGIVAAVLAHMLLHRTLLGIRIKAAGEKPEAVDVAGVSVSRIRIFTSTLGGALSGVGGAFMSLAWFGCITKEMVAGRGFIALTAVIFSGLEPLLALGAAFLFGFTESAALWIAITPGVKEVVPHYFVSMIPYIATLVVLSVAVGRRRFPKAAGKPYIRE